MNQLENDYTAISNLKTKAQRFKRKGDLKEKIKEIKNYILKFS